MIAQRIHGATRDLGKPMEWEADGRPCGVLAIRDEITTVGPVMASARDTDGLRDRPSACFDRRGSRSEVKPLAIDLFCGLGGWTEGLLAEGYYVVGFDIEQHVYGEHRYPAQLVLQDVLTLHGSQFKSAALIVASPPCQGYSYRAMPWSRAKALPPPDNSLFEACFRIQREACEAAGHHIPLIIENVRGAQKWVGRARWNFGSFYLWGDVPALMPMTLKATKNNNGGSWFAISHGKTPHSNARELMAHCFNGEAARKVQGFRFDGSGRSFQSAAVEQTGHKSQGLNWSDQSKRGQDFTRIAGRHALEGIKNGGDWFNAEQPSISRMTSSKSPARKFASAMIAKIPLALSRHIAATFRK